MMDVLMLISLWCGQPFDKDGHAKKQVKLCRDKMLACTFETTGNGTNVKSNVAVKACVVDMNK